MSNTCDEPAAPQRHIASFFFVSWRNFSLWSERAGGASILTFVFIGDRQRAPGVLLPRFKVFNCFLTSHTYSSKRLISVRSLGWLVGWLQVMPDDASCAGLRK